MSDVFTSLALAISRAIDRDLPDIDFERKTWPNGRDADPVVEIVKRRPGHWEVQVYHFPQTWGDTSTGFGGIAGQAFTTAYTTVVIESSVNAAVYFGGRLAYVLRNPNAAFWLNLRDHRMEAVRNAGWYRTPDEQGVA